MASRFPEPGELFEGQYLIESQAGRGGFARIYRAVQQQLERDVALKILKPNPHEDLDAHHQEAFESQVVQRFLREARNVAQLRDPNTVTLYDFGRTANGLFYMVFEFIDGQTLKFAADHNQRVDPERVVGIMQKVLSSLEEAHKLGMLHRDIKPANIMLYEYLGRTDQVKVLDFGISKAVLQNASVTLQNLTQQHVMMGTPRYMSPEQLRGDQIGPPSDLYSLGLVVYELLVGEQAIPHDQEADIINRQISPEPITLPDDVPVTDTLRATFHRMLAKDQSDRFQTTDELLEALAAWNSPRGFAWEAEWLNPNFQPAARDESTEVEQIVAPVEGEGTYQPVPTRQDQLDDPEQPMQTRPNRASPRPIDEPDGGLTWNASNLIALLVGVVSTLVVGGVTWVIWSPADRRPAAASTEPPADTVDDRPSDGRPSPGNSLTIRTQPTDAQIRIDGRLIGRSPLTLPRDELAYPVIVHAERDDGSRLAQKVSSPTDAVTLDFSVTGGGTRRDTGPGGPAPDSAAPDTDTASGSGAPDDESTASTGREAPSDDSETNNARPPDRDDSSEGTSSDEERESDPLIEDHNEPTDSETSDDGSKGSSEEHDFPALDQ